MSKYTQELRARLRGTRAATRSMNNTRTAGFRAAAETFKGRTFSNGLSGLHGAIANDPHRRLQLALEAQRPATRNMTPKQAAALRKAQAASAKARRGRKS
jgi:hypothetical protein